MSDKLYTLDLVKMNAKSQLSFTKFPISNEIKGTTSDITDMSYKPGFLPVDNESTTSNLIETSETQVNAIVTDYSHLAGEVDRWIQGSVASDSINLNILQRSKRPLEAAVPKSSSTWYVFAMMLPAFGINVTKCLSRWKCYPGDFLATTLTIVIQLAKAVKKLPGECCKLFLGSASFDIFAATMDIVLAIYALGFLALSIYHVAIK